MDDGNRVLVQVNLDKAIVENAEAAGIDVARFAEEALRRHVRDVRKSAMNDAEREALRRQINEEIAWRNTMVDEGGLFGQERRTF